MAADALLLSAQHTYKARSGFSSQNRLGLAFALLLTRLYNNSFFLCHVPLHYSSDRFLARVRCEGILNKNMSCFQFT